MPIGDGKFPGKRIGFRKIAAWLHLWLGLFSGLVVFIVSLTGCIYVFEKELKELCYSHRLRVEPAAAAPLPLSALWEKAQAALGPGMPITRVRVENAPDRSYAFGSYKSDPGAFTYFGEQVHNRQVYVDPYDGRVIDVEDAKYEFFNLVLWVHWSLLLSDRIGQPIVGTAVLIFVILLLTGLVLWWPRNQAALRARLQVAWKAKWRRLNWDLHAVPGFYTLIFALIISLTGLVWAFKWFNKSVYFVATGGKTAVKEAPLLSDTASAAARAGSRPLDAVFARAKEAMPEAREYYLSVPEAEAGVITVFARFGKEVHYDSRRMAFDRHTGALLKAKAFADMDRGEKLRALNYDLHTGSILGLPGKILAFLASFACATLPVTGLLVRLGKKRGKAPAAGRGAIAKIPAASAAEPVRV